MHYWVHRNESDVSAAMPLLQRGYLSIGWSAVATREEDILALARNDDPRLRGVVNDAYSANHKYSNLKHFAQFAPGDIVIVPLEDDVITIYAVLDAPIPITEYPLETYLDTNQRVITRTADGLLLRQLGNRAPEIVDIGYVAHVRALANKVPRYEANEELRNMIGLQSTNNCIDRLKDEVDRLLDEYTPNR